MDAFGQPINSLKRVAPFAAKGHIKKKICLSKSEEFNVKLFNLTYANIKNQKDPVILLSGKKHLELALLNIQDPNTKSYLQKKVVFVSQLIVYPKLTIKTADACATVIDTPLLAWHSKFIKKALMLYTKNDFVIEIGAQSCDPQFTKEDIEEACNFFETGHSDKLPTERLLSLLHLSDYLLASNLFRACESRLIKALENRSFTDINDTLSMLEILNISHPRCNDIKKIIQLKLSQFFVKVLAEEKFEIFIERKKLIKKSLKNVAVTLNLKQSKIKNEQLLHLCDLKIAVLKLDGCQGLTSASLQIIKKMHEISAGHFKELSLKNCSFLNDTSLKQLSQMHSLNILNLSNSRSITDQGLRHLPLSLTHLFLKRLHLVSNVSCHHFALMPNLRHLDLSCCSFISDAGIQALPLYLEKLILDKNKKITTASCLHIGKMNELKVLSLEQCKKLNDQAIQHLPLGLNVLWLNDNQLTDAIFPRLKQMHGLTEINLQGNSLSDQEIEQLANDLPNCEILCDRSLA